MSLCEEMTMKLNWLTCISLLALAGQIQCQYDPFLQKIVHTLPSTDDIALPLHFSSPFPFGDDVYSTVYISSNGIISFGAYFSDFITEYFPLCVPVIAGFWDDINLELGGSVQYAAFDNTSNVTKQVQDYLEQQDIEINLTETLAVKWSNVCYYEQTDCSLRKNSFQVVVATDGNSSYAIYTYQCGQLQWSSNATGIGYSAGCFYANIDCELGANVTNIDCLNGDWTNLIYCVSTGCHGSPSVYDEGVQSGSNILPFIELSSLDSPILNSVLSQNSTISTLIDLPVNLPFGTSQHDKAYVNSNGVLSLGMPFTDVTPQAFPINVSVVAPFWAAQPSNQVIIEYGVIQSGDIIKNVKDYLSTQNIVLNVNLVLTAVWTDYKFLSCVPEGNAYQVTIATDGIISFAIFSYRCGSIREHTCLHNTSVGFSAGIDFYDNHEFSFTPNITNIDCLSDSWTNIVYYVGGESCEIPCTVKGSPVGVDQCCNNNWTVSECNIAPAVSNTPTSTMDVISNTPTDVVESNATSVEDASSSTNLIAAVVSVVVGAFIAIPLVLITVFAAVMCWKRNKKPSLKLRRISIPMESMNDIATPTTPAAIDALGQTSAITSLTLLRQIPNAKIIPKERIKLLEMVGKGEFGIVYRGILDPNGIPQPIAAKTIKDCNSLNDVRDIVEESTTMTQFNHPNLLSQIGVCVDIGQAPYIIMPYMAKGPLLGYLVKERHNLTLSENVDENLIHTTRKDMLSMCLQIAKGMEYLVEHDFLHRDLAARNCLMDANNIIKISDFGLSESIYVRRYHRQQDTTQKLPVKWMAIESLYKGLFSEKSDVWSYGVVCWEIFTSGNVPYPGRSPQDVVELLDGGGRLPPPKNAASSEEIFEMMNTCWKEKEEDRPTFTMLVSTVEELMAPLAEYLPVKFE